MRCPVCGFQGDHDEFTTEELELVGYFFCPECEAAGTEATFDDDEEGE